MEIEWQPAMSVGNEAIDEQHKRLLKQINTLIEDTNGLNDLPVLRSVLSFLKEYIDEHFACEENYMQEMGFPELEKHKLVHSKFVEFTKKFTAEFYDRYGTKEFGAKDASELAARAKKFLGEWLVNHILTDDQEYHKFADSKS